VNTWTKRSAAGTSPSSSTAPEWQSTRSRASSLSSSRAASTDDRWGRAQFVYLLDDAGVPTWEYSSKSLVDVSTLLKRTTLNMRFGFAGQESHASSERTREQKVQRANDGRLDDVRVLGYRTTGDAKKRVRVIDDDEAALVRRIFRRASEGAGIPQIAKELNKERVKNPTGQFRQRHDKGGVPVPAERIKPAEYWYIDHSRQVRRESSQGECGLRIFHVDYEGPAHKAGIKPGDLVLTVNGRRVPTNAAMAALLRERAPSDVIRVTPDRAGQMMTADAQLVARE
jgi:hypothetical protein